MHKLILTSSGLKKGPLPDGKDLYIDARALPDPTRAWADHETPYAPPMGAIGTDLKVQCWMREMAPIHAYVDVVEGALKTINHRRENNSKKSILDPITIHTFCAWGIHRSVALKHILASEFRLMGYTVEVI